MTNFNPEHILKYYSLSSWENSLPPEIKSRGKILKEGYDPITFKKFNEALEFLKKISNIYEVNSNAEFNSSIYSLNENIKVIHNSPIDLNQSPSTLEIIAITDRDAIKFAKTLGLCLI